MKFEVSSLGAILLSKEDFQIRAAAEQPPASSRATYSFNKLLVVVNLLCKNPQKLGTILFDCLGSRKVLATFVQ